MTDTTEHALKRAGELWSSGKALEAGQILFELLPVQRRPEWAASILRLVLEKSRLRSRPINTLLRIADRPAKWRKAHCAFYALRTKTLELEAKSAPSEKQTTFLYHLLLAENVAKVIYNASGSAIPRPFDYDSGYWVVSCLRHLVDLWNDQEFTQKAWLKASAVWEEKVSGPNGT